MANQHTVIYNSSYVWTTLSSHLMYNNSEIMECCKVCLVFLGKRKYAILKKFRPPAPQPTPKPPTKENACKCQCRGKTTCCTTGRKCTASASTTDENKGKKPVKRMRTLSEQRLQNYGVGSSTVDDTASKTHGKHSSRKDIDYLKLNDGLDDTLEATHSPKRKR